MQQTSMGFVGGGKREEEEWFGRFGVKERIVEGGMVVDFAKRMEMAAVNTCLQKVKNTGWNIRVVEGAHSGLQYILCRQCSLKEVGDCKVVTGETGDRQQQMVVCRMTLVMRKRKRAKAEQRIKWWKLKREDCCEDFR